MVNANTPAEVEITESVIRGLLQRQCPVVDGTETASLPLAPFSNGWDNDMWSLGDTHFVRMPRRQVAEQLVLNEQRTLSVLAPRLSLPVPVPVHAGVPQGGYPWHWSVVRRFPGQRAAESVLTDPEAEAARLAVFLRELHTPAPADAPENVFRGGGIAGREASFRETSASCAAQGEYPLAAMQAVWDHALAAPVWDGPPLWLHGDLHTANMIVDGGRISAIIDWGDVCSGDPACDLAVAWMLFGADARDVFFGTYGEGSPGLQERARAWALNFGLVYLRSAEGDPLMDLMGHTVLDRVIGRGS